MTGTADGADDGRDGSPPRRPAGSPRGRAESPRRTLSILSLVLGILSLPGGYSLVLPVAGVIVGFVARDREPRGERLSMWGIRLSVVGMLIGFVLVALFGTAPLGLLGVEVDWDWE